MTYEEEVVSSFLREQYSDERLAALLAHAEDGRLSYMSCCCFLGTANADHALQGYDVFASDHLSLARMLPGGEEAETAYLSLGIPDDDILGSEETADRLRRAALIPLIKAEMTRRDRERSAEVTTQEKALVTV